MKIVWHWKNIFKILIGFIVISCIIVLITYWLIFFLPSYWVIIILIAEITSYCIVRLLITIFPCWDIEIANMDAHDFIKRMEKALNNMRRKICLPSRKPEKFQTEKIENLTCLRSFPYPGFCLANFHLATLKKLSLATNKT